MKFFIDTANLKQIEDMLKKGFISGITTNPSILAKEPKSDFVGHIKKIVSLCNTYKEVPLSVEVFAKEPKNMLTQAVELYEKIGYSKLNIKIPVGYEELEVVNKLSSNYNIDVNVTCCFTEAQLQLSALAGAKYVSLFYNRLIDFGGNPIKILNNTRNNFDKNNVQSEIIVGSIRNPIDVTNSWAAGGHIVTAGYNLFPDILSHPQTDKSVEGFLTDFKNWIS